MPKGEEAGAKPVMKGEADEDSREPGDARAMQLLRKRSSAKAWLTRARNQLHVELQKNVEDLDTFVLGELLENLEKHLTKFDELQEEYEMELPPERLDEEVEQAANYRDSALEIRIRARKLLMKLSMKKDADDDVASIASSTRTPDVKLPKLVLPTFSGNVLQWQSWWDQFCAVIHNGMLPVITKFTYLKSLLEGEALEVIHGLSLTEAHYLLACDLLQKRYGRREKIIFQHVQDLLSLSSEGKTSTVQCLRKLQDRLLGHVRSLEVLEIGSEKYGILLTPIVLSCLPHDIRMEWARGCEGKEEDLDWLLDFLDKEIRLRETSQTYKIPGKNADPVKKNFRLEEKKPKVDTVKKPTVVPTATALSTSSTTCGLCKGNHAIIDCSRFKRETPEARISLIKALLLCFRCGSDKHRFANCDSGIRCSSCGSDHHFLLCRRGNFSTRDSYPPRDNRKKPWKGKKKETEPEKEREYSVTTQCLTTGENRQSTVVMQTLEVEVLGLEGKVRANVLFDGGSDRTYIARDLVKRIGPEFVRSELVSYCNFGGTKPNSEELRNIYSMELRGLGALQKSGSIAFATEVPNVCVPLHRSRVPDVILESLGHVKLTENYSQDKKIGVDILVGLDQYWKFVEPQIIPVQEGLVAQKTLFGWMISGSYGLADGNIQSTPRSGDQSQNKRRALKSTSLQLFCVGSVQDQQLERLWDMDIEAEIDRPLLAKFEETISLKEGRYEVALPWKGNAEQLQDNRELAESRLRSLSRKLELDPQLRENYNDALRSMEQDEVIEEVPPEQLKTKNRTFYMPHRPVVKESSSSTKVRPVFDASAKGRNGVSLNDCMETGPNLIPSLVDILVRFRRWPIALAADIQKAFLQISVKEEDRDVHRFLWEDKGVVRVMRFTRVPFGNRCSPFLLNATVKHHLKQVEPSTVVSELEENLYVDDWLTGAEEEQSATQMIFEADEIMQKASMNLTKWGSNSREVLDKSLFSLSDKCEHMCNVKVLGLGWDPNTDSFVFEGVNLGGGLIVTKRVVLSLIARLFDPLGFLGPFIIGLKCLFQQLWKLGLDWDQEVPPEYGQRVHQWIEGLLKLKTWKVPRGYLPGRWNGGDRVQLHAFGDASPDAYGTCVYLVVDKEDGSRSSSLILSKSRVAPLKQVTLPRMELLGALLTAQLIDLVRRALKLESSCCYCWSDSMVALGWIRDDPQRWKPFVANRVSKIQQLTAPSQWNHCPGELNPADLVTRGVSADELLASELWLNGPSLVDVPAEESEGISDFEEELCRAETTLVVKSEDPPLKVFDVERWSTLTKALRILAWIRRFMKNARSPLKEHGPLSLDELVQAKVWMIGVVQKEAYPEEFQALEKKEQVSRKSTIYKLSPYVGKDGLLRVRGRLQCADLTYEEKHPIIIPRGHLAVLIVRFQHILLKHAGVNAMLTSLRGEYWIVGARRVAKRVKKQCVACQRLDAVPLDAPVAPLPVSRVREARPFSVVGLDHAGPLYCADRKGKFYILLFTCAVVRAVHLELVDSLSLEDFLYGFRRFVARRGMPAVIWSDNARTFTAAAVKLPQMFGPLAPRWNYIVPRSPWWGGWWERLVRSVKSALKKTLKLQCLTRVELETTLHEIEACINSRPLTFVSDELEERIPLTPAHFLIGQSSFYESQKIEEETCGSSESLRNRLCVKKLILDEFWNMWSKEYLRHLPQLPNKGGHPVLEVGDLVLIKEDNVPRLMWPTGVVQELFPGRDGVVRSCRLKTGPSCVVRPIQRLYSLEVDNPSAKEEIDCLTADVKQTDEQSDSEVKPQVTTRSGRKIKPVVRLDL